MEDRSSHTNADHVTSTSPSAHAGKEDEAGIRKGEKSSRWWKKKERKGSQRFLVSKRHSANIVDDNGGKGVRTPEHTIKPRDTDSCHPSF